MQKRLQKKCDIWTIQFKENIKAKMIEMGLGTDSAESGKNLLQFIFDYQNLQLIKEDFQKRKRVKNSVPLHDRCSALKAEKTQCTRRRKGEFVFCGTHIKGTPHGVIEDIDNKIESEFKSIQVWAEEILGIINYIDKDGNVYDPQDIHQNITNPRKIAKYTKTTEGKYLIE